MPELKEHAAEWVAIESLNKWENNPRKNEYAIDKVVDSIKRFGFAAPIVARKKDKIIIAGHTRYEAALKIGLTEVPVRFMDLDPADAKLLALADNKLGELAEWDKRGLKNIFETENFDLDDLNIAGFQLDEMDDILEKMEFEPVDSDSLTEIDQEAIHNCPHCNGTFTYQQLMEAKR